MRWFPLALLLVGCGTYNYNRAALVPRGTPRVTTGTPMESTGQIDVGATSVAHLGSPGEGDPNQGVELPGTQLHGGARLRAGKNLQLGILYENGFDAGAKSIKPTQPPVDNGNTAGYGISLDAIIPTGDPSFNIGIGVDGMLWSVPYVQYDSCAAGVECFPYNITERGRDQVTAFAASVTPSYKVDPSVTLFGGVTVRNQPTIQQKGTTQDPILDDPSGEVKAGPANFIVSAGAQIGVADNSVLFSGVLFYDVSRNVYADKPGLGLMLSLPIGKLSPKQQANPPPQQQWYPPPPGGYPPPAPPYGQGYPPPPGGYPPPQPVPAPQPAPAPPPPAQ